MVDAHAEPWAKWTSQPIRGEGAEAPTPLPSLPPWPPPPHPAGHRPRVHDPAGPARRRSQPRRGTASARRPERGPRSGTGRHGTVLTHRACRRRQGYSCVRGACAAVSFTGITIAVTHYSYVGCKSMRATSDRARGCARARARSACARGRPSTMLSACAGVPCTFSECVQACAAGSFPLI